VSAQPQAVSRSLAESAIERIFKSGSAPLALQRIVTPTKQGRWSEALLRPVLVGVDVAPQAVVECAARLNCERALDRMVVLSVLQILQSDEHATCVSFNLCPGTTADTCLPEFVADALATRGIAPERLCVEFPETANLNAESVIHAMHRWKGLGIRVAVDDLGIGSCSLRAVLAGAVDIVKMDAALLNDLVRSGSQECARRAAALAGCLTDMGLHVIFEGVETTEHLRWLERLPHTGFQGFAHSLPEAWKARLTHPRIEPAAQSV